MCVQRKIRIMRHCVCSKKDKNYCVCSDIVCVQRKIRIMRHCVCSKKDKNYETLCVFKER